jgi:hypothetical protein
MARTRGLSGLAIGMIGTGALLIYSAIRKVSPLEELRGIITGKRPEPLSTTPGAQPLAAPGVGGIIGGQSTTPAREASGAGKANFSGCEKSHVRAEMQFISNQWGVNTGGCEPRPANPSSDHPKGLAIDASTRNVAVGNSILAYYQQNAAAKRVKYIIWRGKIYNPPTSPGRTYLKFGGHFDHVHISFYDVTGRGR